MTRIWKRAGWCPWMLAVADGNQTQYAKPARQTTLLLHVEKNYKGIFLPHFSHTFQVIRPNMPNPRRKKPTRAYFSHIFPHGSGNQTQNAKPPCHNTLFLPEGDVEKFTRTLFIHIFPHFSHMKSTFSMLQEIRPKMPLFLPVGSLQCHFLTLFLDTSSDDEVNSV